LFTLDHRRGGCTGQNRSLNPSCRQSRFIRREERLIWGEGSCNHHGEKQGKRTMGEGYGNLGIGRIETSLVDEARKRRSRRRSRRELREIKRQVEGGGFLLGSDDIKRTKEKGCTWRFVGSRVSSTHGGICLILHSGATVVSSRNTSKSKKLDGETGVSRKGTFVFWGQKKQK